MPMNTEGGHGDFREGFARECMAVPLGPPKTPHWTPSTHDHAAVPDLQTPFGAAGRNALAQEAARDGRSDDDLTMHEMAIQEAAASLLASHDRVALSYSGGAESGLLLHLFRPFRSLLTVLWLNPGSLPHEAEHVRRQAEGGPFAELHSDRAAFWAKHGMPSALVPAARMTAPVNDAPLAGSPISPAWMCCIAVRAMPADQWCVANGVGLLIHGQRRGEGSGMFAPGTPLNRWAPLARWSRGEVMRRVAHHAVPLPMQYAEGAPETFECAVCPANLDPARLAFLRRHYPAEHAETLRLAGEVWREVTAAHAGQGAALEAAEADARNAQQ